METIYVLDCALLLCVFKKLLALWIHVVFVHVCVILFQDSAITNADDSANNLKMLLTILSLSIITLSIFGWELSIII